jgi:hypothetical protein
MHHEVESVGDVSDVPSVSDDDEQAEVLPDFYESGSDNSDSLLHDDEY